MTFDTSKACDDILGEILLDFVKITFIDRFRDQLFHVIGRIGIVGDQGIERVLNARRIIKERAHRRFIPIVLRQKVNQTAHFGQRLNVIFKGTIGDR